MNLLTFLGAGKYTPTTYTFNAQSHRTQYCPAATAHFYRPEKTLVVVTEKAEAMHFESLADEIAAVTRPITIPIPDGSSEAELWQIFNALTQHVAEGDELVVDITNGFRSLPFLSFLAIAFLRLARRVKVHCVLYGAWEARNEETNETPVFDLTPFVTLLDWTIATDRFTRFGDAADLAAFLRAEMPPGPLMGTDLQARELGKALKDAAKAMENVSLALRLSRPLETIVAAGQLEKTLNNAGAPIANNLPPFRLLTRQIQRAYHPFVMQNDPLNKENWQITLQIQLDLIERYVKQGQIAQALTLAREWVVSALALQFDVAALTDYEACRKPIENTLNNEVEKHKPRPRPLLKPAFDEQMAQLPIHRELGKVWGRLTDLRNDIAHVGMNLKPKPASRIYNETHNLLPRLQAIFQELVLEQA